MSYGFVAPLGPAPYGQQNPFDQRGNGGGPSYRDDYGSNNVEMAPLAQNAGSFGAATPNSALNEISEINQGIDMIDRNLEQLKMLQQRAVNDSDTSPSSNTNRQLDAIGAETMAQYRSLTERVRYLKSKAENQQKFGQQVRRVDGRLKDAIRAYQLVESDFRKKTQDQMARQYRIVRPDASESEVRAAVDDETGGQVFQQALMQSNRSGQAQSVLNAVQDRHAQLQKIEQQMMELVELFQQMDTLVVEQEAAVEVIEQKGEEVVENLNKGNVEIGTAVNTARATRKKKWICLGICVAIIVVIVIIVVVYFLTKPKATTNNNSTSTTQKRNLLQPDSRAWFEDEAVPLIASRINAEAKRWIAQAKRPSSDTDMIS
ncbi:Uu.00g030380.m01.CDS01 [Anthostomella pinea]|uniref:Uu.00g030380.m01.CDS01 n=1 Tax=Anthostomella pinea TaxID=933095 RepID=A0AAI8V9B0_9PEZI|nr:Uu.00g030380.m01.CDS01 [Anthostomella pinea]